MLLNEMEIFYYIVELKSFSKAAERLHVSKSFISKKLTALEQILKVRLLSRSTRKLILTPAGEDFYHYCANVVREGSEAYSALSGLQEKPSGTLKISAPPALGLNLLSPLLSQFLKKYPDIILNIELENRLVDIVKEGYDLVLRSAKLTSSNLIAQRVFSVKSVICATEKYLKTHATLNSPKDLSQHNFAIYSYAKNSQKITLTKQDHENSIFIQGNFLSNQLELIKKMVLQDTCIAVLPEFMIKNELQNKKLKLCLPTYFLSETPLYVIYPEKKFMLPKMKHFLIMLKDFFERN